MENRYTTLTIYNSWTPCATCGISFIYKKKYRKYEIIYNKCGIKEEAKKKKIIKRARGTRFRVLSLKKSLLSNSSPPQRERRNFNDDRATVFSAVLNDAYRKRVSTPPGKTRRYKAEHISMTSNEHQIAGPKSRARPQKSAAAAVAALPLLNRPYASNGLAGGESFVPPEDAIDATRDAVHARVPSICLRLPAGTARRVVRRVRDF